MQKVKEILTGKDHTDNSTSGTNRASREYASGTNSGVTGNGTYAGRAENAAERLTGDRAQTGTTGSNASGYNTTTGTHSNSGVLGTAESKLTGHQHGSTTSPTTGSFGNTGTTSTTGGLTGSTGGYTGSSGAERLTGDSTRAATGTHSGTTGIGTAVQQSGTTSTGSHHSGSGISSAFGGKHEQGHDSALASKFDPSAETTHHDHKHLQHVTQRDVRHIETEEVTRQREVDRHIHHVQHHVQPVLSKEVGDEVHHEQNHPVTNIREQHVNTDDDVNLFRGLGEKHRDTETHRPKERTIVDRGEVVNEQVHHHVHHITQPVVQQEVHDRHRIHTVIPVHHTTHEAPIIHKSSLHEPIAIDDFKKGGGVLGSGITMDKANVLQTGDCTREVDGVGEKLINELHLGSGSTTHGSSTLGSTGTHGSGIGSTGTHGIGSTGTHGIGSTGTHGTGIGSTGTTGTGVGSTTAGRV